MTLERRTDAVRVFVDRGKVEVPYRTSAAPTTAAAVSPPEKGSEPNVSRPMAGIRAPVHSTRWRTRRRSTPSSAIANGVSIVPKVVSSSLW